MSQRQVTEQDFRRPEFHNAKVEDYEIRSDGKVVRKDRWQTAINTIAYIVGMSSRQGFEVEDVILATRNAVPRERLDEILCYINNNADNMHTLEHAQFLIDKIIKISLGNDEEKYANWVKSYNECAERKHCIEIGPLTTETTD